MAEHHTPRPSQGSQGRLSHPRLCVCSDWRVCLQKTEHGRFQRDAQRFLSLMIVDHPPRTHASVNNPLQRHSMFRSSSSRLPLSVSGTAPPVPMLARARNVSCLSFAQNPHFSEKLPVQLGAFRGRFSRHWQPGGSQHHFQKFAPHLSFFVPG